MPEMVQVARVSDAVVRGVLAGLHDLLGATQPARRRGADLKEVLTLRPELEHRIEGRDLVDADRRHVEDACHLVHRHARQPALLALREVEQSDHGACLPARRVVRHQRLGLGEVLRREGEALDLRDVLGICGDHRHRFVS